MLKYRKYYKAYGMRHRLLNIKYFSAFLISISLIFNATAAQEELPLQDSA